MSPWDCGALSPASASVRSASQPGRAPLSNGSGNCLTASPPAAETPACCDQTRQARAHDGARDGRQVRGVALKKKPGTQLGRQYNLDIERYC